MDKQTEKLTDEAYRIYAVKLKSTRIGYNWPDLESIVGNMAAFLQFLVVVISAVEEAVKSLSEAFTSEQKRDAAVKIVDEQTDTGWLDFFDGKILGLIVSLVVAAANLFLGKDWISRIS